MKNIIKQIHLYSMLIYKISPIFTDQMPTFHAFRKVHSMLSLSPEIPQCRNVNIVKLLCFVA